jgi:hypothetical protein
MTSTLVSFHPRLRDPRLRGAISIAGPSSMFGPRFFTHADVPFLMIAGTEDALVPYDRNAAPMLRKLPGSLLMTIDGATHTGFADPARWLRWLDNPDSLGCAVVKRRNPAGSADGFYQRLGGRDIGMIEDRTDDLCVRDPLPPAMNPLRQHRLTRLGVFAFWESLMAPSAERRQAARRFLTHTLPAERPAVTVSGG